MKTINCLVVVIFTCGLLIAAEGGEWIGDDCMHPLGMESGKIPASRITASSSFDEKSVGPQSARIRNEHNGGAWCPKDVIKDGVKEYLEIDFSAEYRVTQTETQGRFGNGRGLEFAEQFQLEYYRDTLGRWVLYKDHFGRNIFEANRNTYLSVKQTLNPPVIANRLRFIPHSVHPRTVCMRVEAYGCHFTEGVIHYECPQGYWKKNPDVDLRDSSYDGWMDESGILQGGLGLLTDSVLGPSDFRVPHTNKGNMWIGWDNQSDPVKISFKFDTLRKFHEVSIHVNNFVSQGAQVFSSVNLYFSVDGQKFSEFPLRWSPKRDLKNETAYLVQIPLKGRLAVAVRMEFYHSNHWLLLSEIFFRSDIFAGNVTDEIHSLNYLQDGPEDAVDQGDDVITGNSSKRSMGVIIGLIAGSLAVLVVLCVVALVYYVMRRQHRNSKLVGVMGMTPKSMSMGLGGCSDPVVGLEKHHHSSSMGTTTTTHNGRKVGKIALCDLKPVSISGETDSDESLYHELGYGGAGGGMGGGSAGMGGGNSSIGGGSSASTAASKSETSTASLSNQTAATGRRNNNTNRKIKYQRVNHGGDFSDFMGMRNLHHDEMSFFQQQQQQSSSPSTPSSTGLKQNLSHQFSHQLHPNILQSHSTFHHHPPPPPAHHPQQHHNHHLHPQTTYDQAPPHLHHPLLSSLQSKTLSLGNGNCNNSTSVFTTSSSKSSSALPASGTLGFFNSPHGGRRRGPTYTSKGSESNYYAATDIFHVPDKHFERF